MFLNRQRHSVPVLIISNSPQHEYNK